MRGYLSAEKLLKEKEKNRNGIILESPKIPDIDITLIIWM